MFKIRVKLAGLLALSSFVSSGAQAIDLDGIYLGGGLQSATADVQYDRSSSSGTEYGDGVGFNLFAGYKIVDNIALELEGRYWGIEYDNTANHDGDLRGNISTGFKFLIPIADQIDLTANFGLTHWFIKDFDDEDGQAADLATHDLAAYYRLGISSYIARNLELGFSYDMHGMALNQSESFNLYAAYHFGDMRRSAPHNIFSRLYVSFNAAQFSRGGYEDNVGFSSLGGTVSQDLQTYLNQIPGFSGSHGVGADDDSDGYYVFLGYQMNNWVSLELGLVDFGEYEASVGTIRDSNDVEYVINEKLLEADVTGTLFGFKASAYRSSFGLNLYTRFGVNHVKADIERYSISTGMDGQVDTNFIAPYYGAGLSYQVLDSLSVSLDYIVFEMDDFYVNSRSRSIGLGVAYAFGSESKRAVNVRESSIFTDYFKDEDAPAEQSIERTTACDEKHKHMFFGCDDEDAPPQSKSQ